MKVYRVQNKQGEGPYFNKDAAFDSWWIHRWASSNHADSIHPEPCDEPVLLEKMNQIPGFQFSNFVCAFSSLEQLNLWFNNTELVKLSSLGYSIHEQEADESKILFGEKQILIPALIKKSEPKRNFFSKLFLNICAIFKASGQLKYKVTL